MTMFTKTTFYQPEAEPLTELLYTAAPGDAGKTVSAGDILLFDIETTGLSAAHSYIYLIGCAHPIKPGCSHPSKSGCVHPAKDGWQLHQWFAENSSEEFAVLEAFLSFAAPYNLLVSFNGNGFDLPYLRKKCADYLLAPDALKKPMADLYRMLSPYKGWLGLTHVRQKDVEQLMGLHREDPYTGKELIAVYKAYQKASHDRSDTAEKMRDALLLHNLEDVQGMLTCINAMAFLQPFTGQYDFTDTISEDNRCSFRFRLRYPAAHPLARSHQTGSITLDDRTLTVSLPVGESQTVYYYHADYKNYVYDPAEALLLPKQMAAALGQKRFWPVTLQDCRQPVPVTTALLQNGSQAAALCDSWIRWAQAMKLFS